MSRLAIVAVLLLVLGCRRSPTAPAPFLSGTITSRAARLYGPPPDSFPQMRVEAKPGAPPDQMCDNVAVFFLTAVRSVRYASGLAADTSALTVGAKVRAWATGIVLLSCPPQVAADEIVIDSAPPQALALRPNPRLQRRAASVDTGW